MTRHSAHLSKRSRRGHDSHGRVPAHAPAVHRPGRGQRPRLPGEGPALEGGGRRRAERRAQPQRRQPEGRSRQGVQRQLPGRLHGRDVRHRPEHRRPTSTRCTPIEETGRARRHHQGHGHGAHDLHAPRQLQRGDGGERRARPRAAWWTCRWCSTSRARSARRGRRSATPRAASSTRSTRTATAWRSSPTATAPRCWIRCRRGFGFDKDKLKADVPNALPGGTTSMAEGLYRGWDEVRSVASGQQAGLRVIVLFTDGSGNVFPGFLDASGIAKGVFSGDFPKVLPDPTNATTNTPAIQGLLRHGNRRAEPELALHAAQLEQHQHVRRACSTCRTPARTRTTAAPASRCRFRCSRTR